MDGVNSSPTVVPFFFFFLFYDDCLLIKIKCDIQGLFRNRFCRAFLSILNTKAYNTLCFLRSWDTFYHGVNTLPSCALSHLCLSDQIKFFFLGNLPTSFLVVICSVTVACFSAPFSVLTGIFFQIKRLYFTSLAWCYCPVITVYTVVTKQTMTILNCPNIRKWLLNASLAQFWGCFCQRVISSVCGLYID